MEFDIETMYGGGTFHPAYFFAAAPVPDYSDQKCNDAMRRLRQLTELLPGGARLGWQLNPGAPDRLKLFAGEQAQVSTEDYRWICQELGRVEPPEEAEPPAPHCFARLYVLREKLPKEPHACEQIDRGACRELVESLIDIGACLKVSAVRADKIYGTVILAVNREIPLRIRAMAAEAFPALELYEAPDCWSGLPMLPEDAFGITAGALLQAFLKYCSRQPLGGKPDASGAAEHRWYDDMDIMQLDLSIRTFNCLRRANIQTVGELRGYSPEELMSLRNLGRRCTEELQNKLKELETWKPPAQAAPEKQADAEPAGTSLQDLSSLVGLTEVKSQVAKLAAFARMKQAMEQQGLPGSSIVLNMEFTGNPGTAKTTVARILAGILYEIGILKSPDILEVGRAQLVARYVGHTAEKVTKVFEEARGRLLFIDEAYALMDDDRRSFGEEAINTIVQEMENHRSDTVVVFAGYPDRMKALFDSNPGLRSRVPFQIEFPDYSAEELLEIVKLETARRGFESCPEADSRVLSICREIAGNPEQGNGRFCRNLVDAALLNYAARVFGGAQPEKPERFILEAQDFALPSTPVEQKARRPLGFCA